MTRGKLFCAILGLLVCCGSATAQELGYWRATSSTAQSITGDIAFSDAKMLIDFSTYPIVHARDLDAGEVSAVFDADSNANIKGHLYRISIPASKKFLHKNTLCGGEDTKWIATYVEGRSLHLAFFSGDKAPLFTLDAISNSTNLCGIYSYSR